MNIYISGISGTGMGPLALMAKDAGFNVFGSDLNPGAVLPELQAKSIEVSIGAQDGTFLNEKIANGGIDWFVYTSALPADHPELALAEARGIKVSKRDEFIAFLVEKLGLKMVAIAGTHGKTTTTSMIVYTCFKLGIPISYLVGTTLDFAPSGQYRNDSKYFVYEADEYDRNFLKFNPWLSVIPFISYDHPDIYPTRESYIEAFEQFKSQSRKVILSDGYISAGINLAGEARREDAELAARAILQISPATDPTKVIDTLNTFPGAGRRFEQIADGVFTDYAHHPEEIAATIKIALEEVKLRNKAGIVAIYQPHQNIRQHEVRDGYKTAFLGVDKLYWLPTYLTREDPNLPVLTPQELILGMQNFDIAEAAELNDALAQMLKSYHNKNYLILLMTAGPADSWFRQLFAN